jgi:hypothetical protein
MERAKEKAQREAEMAALMKRGGAHAPRRKPAPGGAAAAGAARVRGEDSTAALPDRKLQQHEEAFQAIKAATGLSSLSPCMGRCLSLRTTSLSFMACFSLFLLHSHFSFLSLVLLGIESMEELAAEVGALERRNRDLFEGISRANAELERLEDQAEGLRTTASALPQGVLAPSEKGTPAVVLGGTAAAQGVSFSANHEMETMKRGIQRLWDVLAAEGSSELGRLLSAPSPADELDEDAAVADKNLMQRLGIAEQRLGVLLRRYEAIAGVSVAGSHLCAHGAISAAVEFVVDAPAVQRSGDAEEVDSRPLSRATLAARAQQAAEEKAETAVKARVVAARPVGQGAGHGRGRAGY